MTVDLSKPDAMPDYGTIGNLLDNFGASNGYEVTTHDTRAVMPLQALQAWKAHVNNWFMMNKGNKAANAPSLNLWALNNPQHTIILRTWSLDKKGNT